MKIRATPVFNRRSSPGLFLTAFLIMSLSNEPASAQDASRYIRIAKIVVDSTQLENYKAALREEIEISLHVEPGVLILYAVSEKNNPAHITILETYADTNAYKSHIQTPHFIKYKTSTKEMVKSLELADVAPIAGELKSK